MTDDNRYAPPKSVVASPQPTSVLPERPQQVRTAVVLLWVSLILGIPEWILSAAREPDSPGAVVITITVMVFVLSGYAIIMVDRGRNWARILMLVFALMTLLFMFMPNEGLSPPSQLENSLTLLDLLLDLAAVYLLFTKPGSLWFKMRD